MAEASRILDQLGAGGALGDSARTLVEHARGVPRRPSEPGDSRASTGTNPRLFLNNLV